MAAVDVRDLVVRHGAVTAVDGVSFTADGGEVVALLGPNGAGKTSTVETLEGYRRPTSGEVRVLGLDPVRDRARVTPRIGVMLQEGGPYPALGPLDALRLFAAYYDDPEDPDAMLDVVGLRHVARTPWRRLSGGEQRRLSLGLALLGRPEVAFLDEPSAGMDPAARRVLWDVVRGLRQRGACVLLTTHQLDEAEQLADRVVILDRGRVVAEGSPVALTSGGDDGIRFGGQPGIDVTSLSAHLGVQVVEERPGEYLVDAAPTPGRVADITAWLAERDLSLADLRAGRHSLEDVFLRLTAGAGDVTRTAPAPAAPRRRRPGRQR